MRAETGLPVFEATVFCLMELRATAKMRMTLGQALRSIRAGLQIFEHLGIDIDERMSKGKLLELGEVNQLCTFAAWLQSGRSIERHDPRC